MAMAKLAEERASDGAPVLHLEVGQPSTPAPRAVLDAAARALHGDGIGYTNAPGLTALRERIATHYADWYGVALDPARVMVVAGASAGFTLAFLACFDPGDRVGVVEPGYPCYRNTLEALGCEAVPIPVGPATRWAPTPELVRAAGPLRGLVLASPSNPTGTVLDAPALAALVAECRSSDIRLISDEIYHGIVYGEPARSALELDDEVVVVNSFSKYFSMTGWRLGWLVAPADLWATIDRLQQNLFICAPTLSQRAALAAFECGDELDGHVTRYAATRSVLLEGLARAGLGDLAAADGAFYVYADVSHLTDDSMTLCRTWLDELGIACTPGVDFDRSRGHRFVRFSYAGRVDDVAEACRRIEDWMGRR